MIKFDLVQTSNYRQSWRLHWQMTTVLSSMVEVSMNKIALSHCVKLDGRIAKKAIIGSNVHVFSYCRYDDISFLNILILAKFDQ